MLYFIPAWYAEGQWREQEQNWYARRCHTEVDDTVKHVQLFHRNSICPFRILLLSAAPNFRHFLHRQGVYHAPYWSCFDAIQSVKRKKAALLSFRDLKWPEDVEFFNTMFVVLVMRSGKRYAKVEFGEEGNPIEVEMYEEECPIRKNIYDDRGFLSATIVYQDSKPHHQDFLGEDGVWRVRCFFSDGHVRVNPRFPAFRLEWNGREEMVPYRSLSYSGMEQLIEEVTQAYVERTAREDIFCAAWHPLHMPLLERVLKERNLIVSLYETRNNLSITTDQARSLAKADHLICDSAQGREILLAHGKGLLKNCTAIPPFDARAGIGISQRIPAQKILVPVDGLDPQLLAQMSVTLAEYLQKNHRAQVYLFTRRADYGLDVSMLETASQTLEAAGIPWELPAGQELEENDGENFPVGEASNQETMSSRWFAVQCVDELAITKCLREQRLVVDLRPVRDVYLRVAAISLALPQILMRPSEYVIHGENGAVLERPQQLTEWLEYYLDGLANWNKAMVAAYEVGKRYSVAAQAERWKEVLAAFEKNTCSHPGDGESI